MSYNEELQSNNADLQAILNAVNELPEAGSGGSDGFSPVATVTQTDTGAVIEITDKYGKTTATVNHGKDGSDASVTKASINTALGYTPADPGQYAVSVKALGAKGDGSTDDTTVIQSALAGYRKVYIPGGTYKVSGELVIRDNCQLELAQDAVLNFTQASGNCITMNRSAFLKGNHATVFVPYVFVGRVINVDTSVHTDTKDVPPWTHWDPQWKTARYITDLNICKVDNYGLHQSKTGDCNGTALYVSAVGGSTSTFIWGMDVSGLRIAGAFEYGIRAENKNSGWNHEMRIEAVIDACKIGCSLEYCHNSYASVVFQPRAAADDTVYCEHGIQLISCENTDLTGSRVWDWGYHTTKFEVGGQYQHLALYGGCKGTILNDYNYHYLPGGVKDIRELIYTDTPANFDSIIILQEPFTRWFKPIDTEPYFDNGDGAKRLVLKEEQDALFQTDYVPAFTDQLAKATDGAGAIFNEIGYKNGYGWAVDGKTLVTYSTLTCTGYIKCKPNSVVRVRGMSFNSGGDDCRIIVFNSNLEKKIHVNRANVITNASYYHVKEYTETDDGFSIRIVNGEAAYFTLTVMTSTVSANPVIAVDEEIVYTQQGFLSDGIHVKEPNITGMEKYERTGRMVTQISAASTNEQYPTAKAVYDLVQQVIAAAIGQ